MNEQEKRTDKPAEVQSTEQRPADAQVVVLSPETVREAAATGSALQVVITRAHAGPLPAPVTMREYDDVVPGLPKTIITEFQKEGAHRRRSQTIGQIGAIGVAAIAIVGGVWLGYELKSAAAAFAVIAPVCGIVGVAQFLEFWLKAK